MFFQPGRLSVFLLPHLGSLPTIPINDLRGEEAAAYHREDCVLRRSLAALYRLIDIRGWTQSIYNHISVSSQSFGWCSSVFQMTCSPFLSL